MKQQLIFLLVVFLFCGCYTIATIDTPPVYYQPDYIGITIHHPLWYWGFDSHWYIYDHHPNRRDFAIEKRTHRLYISPRNQTLPASRTRK